MKIITAPVTKRLRITIGIIFSSQHSSAGRSVVLAMNARTKTKKQINNAVLKKNQNAGGKNAGPSQPPKNMVTMKLR